MRRDLGIKIADDFRKEKDVCLAQAERSSIEVIKRFPKCRQVANTFRFDNGEKLNYYAALYSNGKLTVSEEYEAENIIDKVGSGDCFMAGLIHGIYNKRPVQDTLEFATAAAFQKLFIPSDATDQRVTEIEKFMKEYER